MVVAVQPHGKFDKKLVSLRTMFTLYSPSVSVPADLIRNVEKKERYVLVGRVVNADVH